jgi:hypothetical protein
MLKNARNDDQHSGEEARKRFEAALRGARIAGAQHKESMTPKRPKPQRKSVVSNRIPKKPKVR